jgi:glycosyltransferase involved in cell wall biosynthesis
LGIADRVHFLGYRRDVDEIMRAADLFVFPSRSESCPLVLFEALASGLPAIVASTVGASELVTHDCGVVLDDPNDAEGLAHAWEEITRTPALRLCMAQAARAAVEPYGWDRMGEAYLEVYEALRS